MAARRYFETSLFIFVITLSSLSAWVLIYCSLTIIQDWAFAYHQNVTCLENDLINSNS